jgi:hypothetical protein
MSFIDNLEIIDGYFSFSRKECPIEKGIVDDRG